VAAGAKATQVGADDVSQKPGLDFRANLGSDGGDVEAGEDGELAGDERGAKSENLDSMETREGEVPLGGYEVEQKLWHLAKNKGQSESDDAEGIEGSAAWYWGTRGYERESLPERTWGQEEQEGTIVAEDQGEWGLGRVWPHGEYKTPSTEQQVQYPEQQQQSSDEVAAEEQVTLVDEGWHEARPKGKTEPTAAAAAGGSNTSKQLPISIFASSKAAKAAAAAALGSPEGAAVEPAAGGFPLSSAPSTDMYIGSFIPDKALALDGRRGMGHGVPRAAGKQPAPATSEAALLGASEELDAGLLGEVSRRQSMDCTSSCNMSGTLSRSLSAALAGALVSPSWGMSEDGRQGGEQMACDGCSAAGVSAAAASIGLAQESRDIGVLALQRRPAAVTSSSLRFYEHKAVGVVNTAWGSSSSKACASHGEFHEESHAHNKQQGHGAAHAVRGAVPHKQRAGSLPAVAGGASSRLLGREHHGAGTADMPVAGKGQGKLMADGGTDWQERSAGYARGDPGTVAWLQRGLSGKYPGAGLSLQEAVDVLVSTGVHGSSQVYDDMDEPTIWYYASCSLL
jgi:hypothetical protein